MKTRIEESQLHLLNQKQVGNLWTYQYNYNIHTDTPRIFVKSKESSMWLPQLSLQEMLEFLHNQQCDFNLFYKENAILTLTKEGVSETFEDYNLCDVLWQSVKYVLGSSEIILK